MFSSFYCTLSHFNHLSSSFTQELNSWDHTTLERKLIYFELQKMKIIPVRRWLRLWFSLHTDDAIVLKNQVTCVNQEPLIQLPLKFAHSTHSLLRFKLYEDNYLLSKLLIPAFSHTNNVELIFVPCLITSVYFELSKLEISYSWITLWKRSKDASSTPWKLNETASVNFVSFLLMTSMSIPNATWVINQV